MDMIDDCRSQFSHLPCLLVDIMSTVLLFVFSLFSFIRCEFFIGKVDYALTEMDDLHGAMTVRKAIIDCESHENCTGLTYKGPIWDLDGIYQIFFFSWIPKLMTQDLLLADWSTYLVEKSFKLMKGVALKGPPMLEGEARGVTLPKVRAF